MQRLPRLRWLRAPQQTPRRLLSQFVLQRALKASSAILAVLLVASCHRPPTAVHIEFAATYAGQPIGCAVGQAGVALTDLRFYVHGIDVTTSAGRMLPFRLIPDERWQNRNVALVDLEDGQGYCLNGTSALNSSVRGEVALGPGESIEAVGFSIGVPEALNHADPMAAGVPLNYTVMHWHWRSGYKFLRAGIVDGNGAAWLHLGSANCKGTIGNIEGCNIPNRPAVSAQDFDPLQRVLLVDLAAIFAHGRDPQKAARSCESGVADPQCQSMFEGLGLDVASGEVSHPAPAFQPGRR